MNKTPTPDLDVLADAIVFLLSRTRQKGLLVPSNDDWEPIPKLNPKLPNVAGPEELPNFLPHARLAVDGLEFTQSTQHYGTNYDQDNSVPLVALKPLLVRVYPVVRPGLIGDDTLTGQRVTGELIVTRWGKVVYRTGPTRLDGARLGSANQIWRDLWDREVTKLAALGFDSSKAIDRNAPLNFRVPAWHLLPGLTTFTVRLTTESGASTLGAADMTLLDVAAPKISVIRVKWKDTNGVITSPSDEDMLSTMRLAERMLPFPYFESAILGIEEDRSGDFATSVGSGGCNNSWNRLLTSLAITRIFTALFQLGDIVFGFVPTVAIPAGSGTINAGCGRSGVGGCFVGYAGTFAHEIGHIFGRSHVAVAGDPRSDTSYPNYGGDSRSIGEVGVDLGTSPPTLYAPRGSDDIMSYGNNRWISPYTYRAILDARVDHQSEPVDPRRVRPVLVIAFRVYRLSGGGEGVKVGAQYRLDAPGAHKRTHGREQSQISIDFLGPDDQILATHHCYTARSQASCTCCGSGSVPSGREPWLDFEEAIDWPEGDVNRVAFHRGEAPIAEVSVGEAPTLELSGPRLNEQGVELSIRAYHRQEKVTVVVLFSPDDGVTWTPVAFDPPADQPLVIERTRLRGGARCKFRAIATAELQATIKDTETCEMPPVTRGLFVSIKNDPCSSDTNLSALVDTRGLGAVADKDVVWASDRHGELGRGYDLTAQLEPGRHVIVATIPDGLGNTLSERGIIIVGGRPLSAQ